MNTTKLKRFATEARNKLRQGVEKRLAMLGYDDAGIPAESPKLVSGGAVWKDKPCTVAFYNGFKSLEEQIRRYGVSHVVEEAAYTWFNRLMAIRILTMNELCEPVLRYVGSTRTPLIVDEARQGHLPEMDEEDREALMKLIDDDTKTAEQFAMLISAFCHNTPLIAKCFSLQSDYTDVLFPANILTENGFIDSLNTTDFITEEDYHSSELLGWLYQFYISEKKDQVFAKKGKYNADDIPAATQIFTPNWIVKYMVQNTIVPQVIRNSEYGISEAELKEKYKYLVVPPDFNPDGHLFTIHYDLELLKVADLACGSGHILNECFDLLYDLYISEGYTRREAIECIFTQNLTGIDIDTRAKQLATFALMLKACQRDSSLVDASLMPRVYDMTGMPEESRELGSIQIFQEPDSDNPVIAALSTHYDAIVINPPYMGGGSMSLTLSNYVKANYPKGKTDLATVFVEAMPRLTKEGGKYAFIIPPSWMFLSGFESLRKSIIENQSIDSLLHLSRGVFGADFGSSSAIITNEKNQKAKGDYFRLIERTFQEFDQNHLRILFEKTLENPQFRYKFKDYTKDVEEIVYSKEGSIIYYPEVSQKNFAKIPGIPFAYWVSRNLLSSFIESNYIYSKSIARSGFSTGDNSKYVRQWFEVDINKIAFNLTDWKEYDSNDQKYIPFVAGGSFRRWYGNLTSIVDWSISSEMHRPRTTYSHLYLKPGITWNAITSGDLSSRFYGTGFLFEHAAASLFPNTGYYNEPFLAFLNSGVFQYILKMLNPTLNNGAEVVSSVPMLDLPNSFFSLVNDNVSISKEDWDAHETSWDFKTNELVRLRNLGAGKIVGIGMPEHTIEYDLQQAVESYKDYWEDKFLTLHKNEVELNQQYIELYGLQDELNSHVDYEDITILQQGEISLYRPTHGLDFFESLEEAKNFGTLLEDERMVVASQSVLSWQDDVIIKQFISYVVGCMMGRYRLDRPGLAIAYPNESTEDLEEYEIPNACQLAPNVKETFWIDSDGIIPLLPLDSGFHDNAVDRFATIVRQLFGFNFQSHNLNYIEECLGKSLEQYFIKDFWKDHKKMYQNRPIYWLFASKKGAFQVLVYVHRMNVATVERIRSRYLLPYIERLKKRIEDLQANESTLSTKLRNQLKTLRAQVDECEEYHNRLAVVAERGIVPNLDDGIIKNHALYGDIVTKLK